MEIGIIIAVFSLLATSLGAYYTWRGIRQRPSPLPENSNNKLEGSKEDDCVLSLIFSKQSMNVGIFKYPPLMDYVNINGEIVPSGIYGELVKLLATKHSLLLNIVPTNLSDSVSSVERGEVDFVACIFQTPERSKRVDFTAFLHSIAVGGVTLKSNNQCKTPDDLQKSECMIVVCKDEIGHEFAEKVLSIPKRRLIIIDTIDISDMVAYLISGKANVALADAVSCKRFLDTRTHSKPALKPRFRRYPLLVCQNGFMVKKNQKRLADWLNKELHLLRDDPLVKELEEDVLEEYAGILTRL